ncbi:hypothetical protein ElyMa_001043300 [Elysia marginata]|uniref:Uncharacterized protein n=1 Tax=Elysia marginata TaxID=1093978 RepID=A0AAV4HQD2_9GAST|nr:hypothetical protein ElyMa_001043300 [Elysia marginata]
MIGMGMSEAAEAAMEKKVEIHDIQNPDDKMMNFYQGCQATRNQMVEGAHTRSQWEPEMEAGNDRIKRTRLALPCGTDLWSRVQATAYSSGQTTAHDILNVVSLSQ